MQNLFTLHNVAQVAAPRSKFALPPSGAAAAILAQSATIERRCFTLKTWGRIVFMWDITINLLSQLPIQVAVAS